MRSLITDTVMKKRNKNKGGKNFLAFNSTQEEVEFLHKALKKNLPPPKKIFKKKRSKKHHHQKKFGDFQTLHTCQVNTLLFQPSGYQGDGEAGR